MEDQSEAVILIAKLKSLLNSDLLPQPEKEDLAIKILEIIHEKENN